MKQQPFGLSRRFLNRKVSKGEIDLFKWYFGTNNVPESKAEAIVQMALGIAGGSLVMVVLFVMVARWWLMA